MIDKEFELKEDDIYRLFNEVKLEESEFNDMGEEIGTLQKERIKKNLNKKIRRQKTSKLLKYGAVSTAAGLVIIIGIGMTSPAFADSIPILESITQTLNDRFGFHGEYAKYSQIVNKSVTDKGISLTINEVLADNSKLIIGYTIKSDKKINDLEVCSLGRFLKINGKTLDSNGTGTGNYVDNYTYTGTEEINTSIPQNADSFNIDLNVTDIGNIKGNWKFAFITSTKELLKNSIIFNPNSKIDFPDSTVTIDKVDFSPIDTSIFLSGISKNTKSKDSNAIFDYDYWVAFDDKGEELIPKGIGGGESNSNTNKFSSKMEYVSTKTVPKCLTIIPCKIIPSAGGGVSIDKNGKKAPVSIKTKEPKEVGKIIDGVYPIVLSQGNMGKLVINEITTKNNKTTVRYTAEGKAPYFQADSLLIKDDKGNDINIKDYNIRKNEQNPNEFTKVFEALDASKKYTIYTNDFSNVEFREDLKFNIQLNK